MSVVIISKLCTAGELVKSRLPDAHLNSEAEKSEEVIPPSFKDTFDSLFTLRTVFVSHNTK